MLPLDSMTSLTGGGSLAPSSAASSSAGPFSAGMSGGFSGGGVYFAPSVKGNGSAGLNVPSWAWLAAAALAVWYVAGR